MEQPRYERRAFLLLIAGGSSGYVWWTRRGENSGPPPRTRVKIAEFDASGRETGVVEVGVIRKTNSEWMKQLPADAWPQSRVSKIPSSPAQARTTSSMRTGSTAVFVAARRFSIRNQSTLPAQDGRVSRSPLRRRTWSRRRRLSSGFVRPRSSVPDATGIWGMCSMMVHHRGTCGIASTRQRCVSRSGPRHNLT